MVTYTAGETRDPVRTIPRALLIGTLTVTTIYVLLNAAYLYLLPIDRVIGSPRVAADAAQAVAGPRGASLISALVILSATGVLNGVILSRTAHLLRHGQGRSRFPLARLPPPRHRAPGRLVVRPS